MLSDLELMRIQARALFTHDEASRILFVNEPDNAVTPAPRLFLGRTPEGNIWRFRAGLPEKLCEELNALCAEEPPASLAPGGPRHFEEFVRLLESDAPVRDISSGPAYRFTEYFTPAENLVACITENNAGMLSGGFEHLIDELPAWQPFVALIEQNRAVSICRSVRITAEAHEAGVETLPDFRGRGYAAQVTAEWARRVLFIDATPLYSTSRENTASQAIARKLRLKCYGIDFQIN
jgi:GNAT acetyltransferase